MSLRTTSPKLIERYAEQIKGFGVLPFEMEKPTGASGGRPERFYLLNEDQSFFLLTLSRNTPRVVALKASLVKAFREARRGAEVNMEYLPGYHQLHDLAHERCKAENSALRTESNFGLNDQCREQSA